MRSGAVLSTRAISTSAGRPSAIGELLRRASDAAGGSSEESRKIGLLMVLCSRQGGRVRYDEQARAGRHDPGWSGSFGAIHDETASKRAGPVLLAMRGAS